MVLIQLVWILHHLTIGVWRIFFLLLYLSLFLLVACFRLSKIFEYWAPSSGEIWNFSSRLKYERSSLLWMKEYWGGDFLADFALIIAIHQIEMISFIKFFPVIRFFLLQLMLLKYYVFVAWLCWCWVSAFLTNFAWICVGVLFLRHGQVVFSSAYLFSSLLRWILFARMLSYCAPSSGGIWN